jgi:hypothetical protein
MAKKRVMGLFMRAVFAQGYTDWSKCEGAKGNISSWTGLDSRQGTVGYRTAEE